MTKIGAIAVFCGSKVGSDPAYADAARSLGFELLGAIAPLRRFVMRRGLGPVANLPRSMRRKSQASVGAR